MIDFKVIKLDNVKFSHAELVEYYNKIVGEFQHLKWTPSPTTEVKTHKVDGVYSWAIQSNLKDPTKPCAPYHIDESDDVDPRNAFDVPTPMIFGFAKKIIEAFPNVRQTVIAAHPPGTKIDLHIDTEDFVKIHIPIKANPNSMFQFEDEEFNLEEGSAYLINTAKMHGVTNYGDTDRVHFIFKIRKDEVDTILNNEWTLDPSLFDWDLLELPNVHFDYNELAEYYAEVESKHTDLKWTIPEKDPTIDPNMYWPGFDDSIGIYGYGIQSNLDNVDEPLQPPGNFKQKPKKHPFTKPTKLVFGFAEKVLNTFPKVEELGITAHPTGSKLFPHVDKDTQLRIHLPIKSTPNSYFVYGDKNYVLEIGKAYIVNTKRKHATSNEGLGDRIHMLLKVPIGLVGQILKNEYTI